MGLQHYRSPHHYRQNRQCPSSSLLHCPPRCPPQQVRGPPRLHAHPSCSRQVRKPNLPSTPSPSKKPMSTLPSVLDIPDSPPVKRISTDGPQPGRSKRFKPSFPIKNVLHKTPKGKTHHCSPDRRETSGSVDSLNLGIDHAKHPPDPFKFTPQPPPSFSSPHPLSPTKFSPQKSPLDFSDLDSVHRSFTIRHTTDVH